MFLNCLLFLQKNPPPDYAPAPQKHETYLKFRAQIEKNMFVWNRVGRVLLTISGVCGLQQIEAEQKTARDN